MSSSTGLTEEQMQRYLDRILKNVEAAYEQLQHPDLWEVTPGSSLAGDDKATAPYQLSHAVRSALSVAVDHMHATSNLLVHAKALHPMAPFTLARAAIEAGSSAIWMLGPAVRRDRVLRRLQLAVVDARDGDQATQGAGLAANRPLPERINQLRDIARLAGLATMPDDGRPPSVTSMIKAADLTVATPLSILTAWQVCSGIAHGRMWARLSLLLREEVGRELGSDIGQFRMTSDLSRLVWALNCGLKVTQHAGVLYQQRATKHH
jgi:hypothetical protein